MQLLIAGDQPSSRKAISLLVRTRLGIEVAGEASNYDELIKLINSAAPDLILLDSELPGINMTDLIATLHGLDYSPSVIVLSERPEMEGLALAAGADEFIPKTSPPKQLLIAIENLRAERGHH